MRDDHGDWAQAVEFFCSYLPSEPEITEWIISFEPGRQGHIARSLATRLPATMLLPLGETPPSEFRAAAQENRHRSNVGFIGLDIKRAVHDHPLWAYSESLLEFAQWPTSRVKLATDVWDDNFSAVFAEDPALVRQRCRETRDKLLSERQLTYTNDIAAAGEVVLNCTNVEWVAYSGLETFDYMLPSGEVACSPQSVDGVLPLQGWVIGTIPFGRKYGLLAPGELAVEFAKGCVTRVFGDNRSLCSDLDTTFERLPTLREVGELGIGQSDAVVAAAREQGVTCRWVERHTGMHIGLGAELSETVETDERATSHHVDLVTATGTLHGAAGPVFNW